MNPILGGVLVGVLVAGAIAAIVIPALPASARGPRVVWVILALAIAGVLWLRERRTKTPPGPPNP